MLKSLPYLSAMTITAPAVHDKSSIANAMNADLITTLTPRR
ncbi:TPA: hypothetical protein ACKP1B_003756 [Serratia fonticola]